MRWSGREHEECYGRYITQVYDRSRGEMLTASPMVWVTHTGTCCPLAKRSQDLRRQIGGAVQPNVMLVLAVRCGNPRNW